MTTFLKYQAWMQKSREPALLTPVIRFWLSMAFLMTAMHIAINISNLMGNQLQLMVLVPLIVVSILIATIFSPIVFQRFIGEINLGQRSPGFNLAIGSRIAVMAAIYGWIGAGVRSPFDPLTLIKLPIAILIAGFIFEMIFGQISWFKPTPITKSSPLESAA